MAPAVDGARRRTPSPATCCAGSASPTSTTRPRALSALRPRRDPRPRPRPGRAPRRAVRVHRHGRPGGLPRTDFALVCGRHLTWYGPSLVEARDLLEGSRGRPPGRREASPAYGSRTRTHCLAARGVALLVVRVGAGAVEGVALTRRWGPDPARAAADPERARGGREPRRLGPNQRKRRARSPRPARRWTAAPKPARSPGAWPPRPGWCAPSWGCSSASPVLPRPPARSGRPAPKKLMWASSTPEARARPSLLQRSRVGEIALDATARQQLAGHAGGLRRRRRRRALGPVRRRLAAAPLP